MIMISLIGPKGSGKSEIAKYATAKHGFVYTRFADPLKGMLALIVDDNRFMHEYHRIKQYSGSRIVEVRRDGCVPGDHQSEKEFLQIPVDFIIDNNGSLGDLHRKVDQLILRLIYQPE